MVQRQSGDPKQICETILREDRQYNLDRGILRSHVAVANRLLARGVELTSFYAELHSKLGGLPFALNDFFGLVLHAAAFWNPEKMAQARTARRALDQVNESIAAKANELAELLARRSELHNKSGFAGDTHYHVCELITAAGHDNHLYKSRVQTGIEALRTQYGLKYWPTPSELLQELASDAAAARSDATDPLTAAAIEGKRSSPADFVHALLVAIEKNSTVHHGRLPGDFKLSDASIASLMNCALDLDEGEMVGGPYIKRLRQRVREQGRMKTGLD